VLNQYTIFDSTRSNPTTAAAAVHRRCNSLKRTFSKLELVQNRRFTGSIQTHHQDAHLFLAELLTEGRKPW